jgi:3-methyladenine DNA glycosylase/8-oxoguanine DNA glycosylase
MLLIFRLGRPDVLPADDYGVRKGFAATFRKRDLRARRTSRGAANAGGRTARSPAGTSGERRNARRNSWRPTALLLVRLAGATPSFLAKPD